MKFNGAPKQSQPMSPVSNVEKPTLSNIDSLQTYDEREFLKIGVDIKTYDTWNLKEVVPKLLKAEADVYSDISTPAFDYLTMLAGERSEEFSAVVISLLDFENRDTFDATDDLLVSLCSVYRELAVKEDEAVEGTTFFGRDDVPQEVIDKLSSGTRSILETIETAIKDKKGNYILNKHAEGLIEEIRPQTEEHFEQRFEDGKMFPRPVFSMPELMYGYRNNKGDTMVSEPADYNSITDLLVSYEIDEKALNENSTGYKSGLSSKRADAIQQFCTRKLTYEDVALVTPGAPINVDKEKQYMKDFNFILTPAIRASLEDDFKFDFSSMSKHELFYLITFLRDQDMEEVEAVKSFAAEYGIDGLRTFLVSAQNPDMTERIFTFATLTDPEMVSAIFKNYASIIEHANTVESAIKSTLENEPTLAAFPKQFFESFVRRSAHLFFAAEKMSTGWYDVETAFKGESMHDLHQAFKGISLLSEVLADIGAQKKFTFAQDQHKTQQGTFSYKVNDSTSGEVYGLKVFIRPRSEVVQRSGKKSGGEGYEQKRQARINVELSLDNLPPNNELRKAFFGKTEYLKDNKSVETSTVRFGLDLDDEYDPPRLSFDMGRNAWQDNEHNRTGDVLGRILDMVGPEGHHITQSFDKELSKPEHFARIAELLQKQLTPQPV